MSGQAKDRELQETFARLEQDLPRVAPPENLFAEIRAQIAPADAPVARPSRWTAWRRPRFVPVLAGAAAAAATVAIAVVLLDSGGSPAFTAALVGHRDAGVRGNVELFAPASADGRVGLEVRDLRPAPAGHHYTVWVLRTGSTQMTPVGSFAVASPQLELPLPGAGRYAALDISLQRDDAPPTHSGISVAGATFG